MTTFARERPTSLPPDQRNSLQPFTEAAIEALFLPGPSAQPGMPVEYTLGWINTTIKRTLDEHFSQLQAAAPNAAAVTQIPPDKRSIQAEQLRSARDALNLGR
jgi:hypothetical protein